MIVRTTSPFSLTKQVINCVACVPVFVSLHFVAFVLLFSLDFGNTSEHLWMSSALRAIVVMRKPKQLSFAEIVLRPRDHRSVWTLASRGNKLVLIKDLRSPQAEVPSSVHEPLLMVGAYTGLRGAKPHERDPRGSAQAASHPTTKRQKRCFCLFIL